MKWREKSRNYKELDVGTAVAIQNQSGNNPTKWDKTGIIIENKPNSKVVIRVDGSRRITVRNRRFVKPIGDVQKHKLYSPGLPMHPTERDGLVREHHHERPETYTAPPSQNTAITEEVPEVAHDSVETDNREMMTNDALPVVQEDLADNNKDSVDRTPTTAPRETSSCDRPKRSRKPNQIYNPEEYDLSTVQVKLRVKSRKTIRRAK